MDIICTACIPNIYPMTNHRYSYIQDQATNTTATTSSTTTTGSSSGSGSNRFYHDVYEICWPQQIRSLKLGHVISQRSMSPNWKTREK